MNWRQIQKGARILGLSLGALHGMGSAKDFTLVTVGAFGEPLAQCRVDTFRLIGAKPGTRNEYKDSFRGLVGSNLPDGDYKVGVGCVKARIVGSVHVDELSRFSVFTADKRIRRSDQVIPHLVIRMGLRPYDETWWVTMHGVYSGRTYQELFQHETGEVRIADPDPGSYLVTVLSSSGNACRSEIDLVETTRLWTFNPVHCTFQVDESAHVVTDEDRREDKKTGWYEVLKLHDADFLRALQNAPKADGNERLK
jgi:hypothetical protein